MAENQEIKQVVKVEGEEALRKLRELAAAQKQVGESVKESGKEAKEAERANRGFFGSMSDGLRGMVSGMLGFTAIVGAVISGIKRIGDEAVKSAQAVIALGQSMRGLSANIGGARAAEVQRTIINPIADESGFSPGQRDQLIEAVSALTDARPNLTNDQIRAATQNIALLMRTTSVGGGAEAFGVMQSLGANLGVSDDAAVDTAVAMLNSGYSAQSLEKMAATGGTTGGIEFMALVSAARQEGLTPDLAARSATGLIGALSQRDERGRLSPALRRAGVTEDMSLTQRFAHLVSARASGRLSQGQFERAIGGAGNMDAAAPMMRALEKGLLAPELAAITDPNAAEAALSAILENPSVRAAERQNIRDLYTKVRQEESILAPHGEAGLEPFVGGRSESNFVNTATGLGPMPLRFDSSQQRARNRVREIGGNVTIYESHVHNSNPVYHGPAPLTEEVGKSLMD